MPELGSFAGAYLGPLQYQMGTIFNNAATTQTLTGTNAGWCARVMPRDTRDIKSVALNFSAATSPGTITLRIETIDNSSGSGKPSSILYDPSATKQFTPTGGWNIITFDSLPTSGLIAGNQYAVVLLKDNSGTTCTLRSHYANSHGNWPTAVLQAANGSGGTRSNFAEVANVSPIGYFILEDDTLVDMGCVPSVGGSTLALNSTSVSYAQKIILPRSLVVRGVKFNSNAGFGKAGTPTGDVRVRVLDNSNTPISGTTVIIDKDTLFNTNGRGLYIPFSPVTLTSGTYRVAFDASGSDGGNTFSINYIQLADSAFQSSGFSYSASSNITGAFTWTDDPTRMLGFGLELDSIPVSAGAGDGETGSLSSGTQNIGSMIHIMFPGRQWLMEPNVVSTGELYSLVGLWNNNYGSGVESTGGGGSGSAVSLDSTDGSYTRSQGGMRLNLGLLGSSNSITYGQGQMRSSLRFSGLSSSIVNLYGNLGVQGTGGLLGTLFSTQIIQYNYSPYLYSRTGAGGSGQVGNITVHGGLRTPYIRDVNKNISVFSRMQSRLRSDEPLTISGIVSITGNYRFVINARNENNQAINLTTTSGTTVIFTSPSSEVIRRGASYVTDGTDGSVYTITSGSQFAGNGTWCLQLQTTGIGVIYTSKKYRFKVG